METLFSEFSPASKAEWLEKVEKDLKGKGLDSLSWEWAEHTFSPFFHADDQDSKPLPIGREKGNNQWEIGEEIIIDDPKVANTKALHALERGVQALNFSSPTSINPACWKGIRHEWIHTQFAISDEVPSPTLSEFVKHLENQGQNPQKVAGSISGNSSLDIFREFSSLLPKFHFFMCKDGGKKEASEALADILLQAHQILFEGSKQGISTDKLLGNIQASLKLNDRFFPSIAKVRAWKLLWINFSKAFGGKVEIQAPVEITLDFGQETDANTNMIRAGAQAMAALMGGADRLFIRPSDGHGTQFSRRIARNVQHLLAVESYFDRVIDPGAGSYFIEHLTNQIAKAAWTQFQGKLS